MLERRRIESSRWRYRRKTEAKVRTRTMCTKYINGRVFSNPLTKQIYHLYVCRFLRLLGVGNSVYSLSYDSLQFRCTCPRLRVKAWSPRNISLRKPRKCKKLRRRRQEAWVICTSYRRSAACYSSQWLTSQFACLSVRPLVCLRACVRACGRLRLRWYAGGVGRCGAGYWGHAEMLRLSVPIIDATT